MKHILMVGAGGFIGAIARYKIGGLILHHTPNWRFPAGTFAVNVLGCLVAGILTGLAVKHDMFTEEQRLLLFTGILGGFTTLSAFGVETIALIQKQQMVWALVYVLSTVILGFGTLWLGLRLMK